jgi:phage/plasmid primase-like uncharacterized protein
MSAAAHDERIARARSVRIEHELARRGIKLSGTKVERAGPCPRCGGDDRFSINTKKQIFNCRGCGGRGDVISLVMFLDHVDIPAAVEHLAGAPPSPPTRDQDRGAYEREQHRKAAWLWSQRKPITGTVAETYMRARGITCALPPTLGFLPTRKPGQHPAMIAAFALAAEPEPGMLAAPNGVDAVHLTLLRADGTGKADVPKAKLMIGSPGALPIVIAPPNDLLGLAITEGIEDALTVHQATGLGVWAAAGAGRMSALADLIPSYIDCVSVAIDDDEAGTKHGTELVHLIKARGIEARPIYLKGRST